MSLFPREKLEIDFLGNKCDAEPSEKRRRRSSVRCGARLGVGLWSDEGCRSALLKENEYSAAGDAAGQ